MLGRVYKGACLLKVEDLHEELEEIIKTRNYNNFRNLTVLCDLIPQITQKYVTDQEEDKF